MISTLFAEVPADAAVLNAIMQTGAFGLICAWLMWRDGKQAERIHTQEERREARHEETQKEIRLQRQAIDDLIRMMGLEVLSRPQVAQRAAHDAQQIIEAVNARKSE